LPEVAELLSIKKLIHSSYDVRVIEDITNSSTEHGFSVASFFKYYGRTTFSVIIIISSI